MCQENVANRREFSKRKIPYARTRIDKYVIVDQHRGSTRPGTNAATATEYPNTHNVEGSIARHHMG